MNYFNILNSKEILPEYNQRNVKPYGDILEDELVIFLRINQLNGSTIVHPQLDVAFPLHSENTNSTLPDLSLS